MPTTCPDAEAVVSGADTGDVVADFADAARQWAHRNALLHNGVPMTYAALAQRVANRASRYRTDRSGTENDLIGLLVSHSPAVVEHLLAILGAGATYCPIDATLPDARKRALATALGVNRLVTLNDDARDTTITLAERLPHGSDPAYLLCTSGSSGTPKPVVVSRRALTVTVRALRDLFELTPQDRVLQFASLGWDTCLEEILPAVTSGATLVFDDAAHCGSFGPFVRMLAERRITVLDLPTAFWHELVLYLHDERAALPGSVRLVVIGGERVDATRLRQWRDLPLGHIRLLNTYGCTETTMITHAVQLSGPGTEPDVAAAESEAPLGRPLPHVRDHVTAEGELLVSGPSLATGYLGLPDVTARAFPTTDLGSGPTRWFHTGDLCVRGAGDLLYSRGRADEQLKISGVRVHPAEVEAQLNGHPAVLGAVVTGERLLGRTSLVAYVVVAEAVTPAELKRHLRERLPSQFVPTRVKFVTALAYTASGKVDRAATRRAAAD